MHRLDYKLHEFARRTWVSQPARDAWRPQIERLTRCWRELEWKTVVAGLRQCGLVAIDPDQLESFRAELGRHDLVVEPIHKLARTGSSYTSEKEFPKKGEPFEYWSVVGDRDSIKLHQEARSRNDQDEIGRLLGYPACCRRFFQRYWVEERFIDTTWPMALNTEHDSEDGEQRITIDGLPQTNILLRWLGVRPVFHLPCSFQCQDTVALADGISTVATDAGYGEEMRSLTEMLSWPVEWSALHGIAEIKTPVAKISASTDATGDKYTVRYLGSAYPQEGATGLDFPYQQPDRRIFTESKGFKSGLANPISIKGVAPDKE